MPSRLRSAIAIMLRLLLLFAMLSAVIVMSQQSPARFVYGGF